MLNLLNKALAELNEFLNHEMTGGLIALLVLIFGLGWLFFSQGWLF